ncbi:DUF3368 domain-containing protein [Mucilaginibacter sp. HD30]
MSKEFQSNFAVITDTSCFILLDKINAFSVLNSLYKHVVTTPQIASEFAKPLPEWIEIKSVRDVNLLLLYAEKVDIGEASAIALALELPSAQLILDDLKGRNLAAELKLNYTGTLGVLVLAKQRGVITQLKPYFDKIKSTDFRVADGMLQKILEASGE